MSIFKNRMNLIPLFALICSVIGVILTACHILIPGAAAVSAGLILGIVTRVIEKKQNLNEALAYWAFALGITLFIVGVLGFIGYNIWDYVNGKDIG